MQDQSTKIDIIAHHFERQGIQNYRPCLDHGHVCLLDCMPRIVTPDKVTADHEILRAARNSYISNKDKVHTVAEDRGLIRYLMRNRHSTPFEMVVFKFDIKLPIFVARQLVRHRMSSLNEVSARYSKLPGEFYMPELDAVRAQSKHNKQGSEGQVDPEIAKAFIDWLQGQVDGYERYEYFIEKGVGNEMARMGLPLNVYTQWIWKIDLKNLLDLLALRCDHHAQYEIRVFANAMLGLITPLVPWSVEAWEDFSPLRDAIVLTGPEVQALKRAGISLPSVPELDERVTSREKTEWADKLYRLSLVATPEKRVEDVLGVRPPIESAR